MASHKTTTVPASEENPNPTPPPTQSMHPFRGLAAELRLIIYQNTFRSEHCDSYDSLEHMLNFLVALMPSPRFFCEATYEFVRHTTIVLSFESCPGFMELLSHDHYAEVWETLPLMPKVKLVPNAYVHPSRRSFPKGRKSMDKFTSFASKVGDLTIDFTSYPEYRFDNQGYLIWDFERFRNLRTLKMVFPVSSGGLEEAAQSRLGDAIEKANQFLGVTGRLSSVQRYSLSGTLSEDELHDIRRVQRAIDRKFLKTTWRQVPSYRNGLKHLKFWPNEWLVGLNLPWKKLLACDLLDSQLRLAMLQTEEWFWKTGGENSLGCPPKNFLRY